LRRDESLMLPVGEAFAQQFEHFGFAVTITGVGCGVALISLRIYPTDAVEAFLKHIARARHYILVSPVAQSSWTTQCFHRPRPVWIERIDHPAVDNGGTLL